MDSEEYTQKLNLVGIDLVEALQKRLTWARGRFTGELSRSIEYRITKKGLQIIMEDYAKYIEYGTPNPTTPDEILSWVKQKIIPKLKKKPKNAKAVRRIAERLARHISLYGPRPYPFIRMTLQQDLPNILQKNGL